MAKVQLFQSWSLKRLKYQRLIGSAGLFIKSDPGVFIRQIRCDRISSGDGFRTIVDSEKLGNVVVEENYSEDGIRMVNP